MRLFDSVTRFTTRFTRRFTTRFTTRVTCANQSPVAVMTGPTPSESASFFQAKKKEIY